MSMVYKIFGGRILVFGDLHLSCTYEGQHKDYTLDCYKNMDNIVNKVKEQKPSAVFFLGDLIGVNERNIRDRQFLLRVLLFLKTLNELTGGNVFIVKGNHDIGDFSDFDFFIGAGLLKNPDYVDYYRCTKKEYAEEGEDALEVRFHFLNYGEENRELKKDVDGDVAHIALGHADFIIDGVTNWYEHKGGVHLNRLSNLSGVDLVLSGHIHSPSPEVLSTAIGDWAIDLFYTGSPSRTAERFDDCWYVYFEYSEEEDGSMRTSYAADFFGLEPAEEVFHPKEVFINGEEDEEVEEARKQSESLTNIVKEIMEGRILEGDLFSQVRAVPHATDKVKDIACDYLQRAIDMGK